MKSRAFRGGRGAAWCALLFVAAALMASMMLVPCAAWADESEDVGGDVEVAVVPDGAFLDQDAGIELADGIDPSEDLAQLAAGTATVQITGTYGQTEARSMLQMINSFRANRGTNTSDGSQNWYWNNDNTSVSQCNGSQLVYDYALEQIAMQRAMEVAITFKHNRPDGTSNFTCTYNGTRSYGENIAAGQGTALAAFTAWREDAEYYSGQGHRRNMLNSEFTAVGIGHVFYQGYHYWVQEFSYYTSSEPSCGANDSATVKTSM